MKHLRALVLLPFVLVQVIATGCDAPGQAEQRQLRARAEGQRMHQVADSGAAQASEGTMSAQGAPKTTARKAAPVAAVSR